MVGLDAEIKEVETMDYREDFIEWLLKEHGITEEELSYCLSGSEIQAYYQDFIEKYKKIRSK